MNHENPARYTASIMGNPDYLDAIKDIVPSKDRRMEGLEGVNAFHKARMDNIEAKLKKAKGKKP